MEVELGRQTRIRHDLAESVPAGRQLCRQRSAGEGSEPYLQTQKHINRSDTHGAWCNARAGRPSDNPNTDTVQEETRVG
jgi:hypothetical protein